MRSILSENVRIIDIINRTTEFFKKKGIESPRLNIELLICDLLDLNRLELYLYHDRPLTEAELDRLRLSVNRIAKNEPLQYVIGKTEFYDTNIKVKPGVLIPRPETEFLVDEVIKRISDNDQFEDVLDIGTGSGCIATAISKALPDTEVYGIDISAEALKIAKENAEANGTQAKFKRMDILTEVPGKKFSAVVSNPPYINQSEYARLDENVVRYEPATALTDNSDGLTFYRRLSEIMPEILDSEGFFALEIGYGQADEVCRLFAPKFVLELIKDLAGIDRIIIGEYADL